MFNSNGNFSQLNDYDLTSDTRYADMVNRVSADNHTADKLCATLRVEDGRVELNGSVKLGDPNNKLLGVHIGNDISQDLVVNTTLLKCTNTKGICTDNGPNAFDIDRTVAPEFPDLDDPPSATRVHSGLLAGLHPGGCSTTGSIELRSEHLPSGARWFHGNDLWLVHGRAHRVGHPHTRLRDHAIDCTVKDGSSNSYGFEYPPGNPGSLNVYGNIDFQGFNLQFNQPTVLRYNHHRQRHRPQRHHDLREGRPDRGRQWHRGDIDLNAKMLTGNNGGYPDYPNHVLAFVAENDVFQGGSSVMAPIYAGGTYRIVKDNTLIGSVIADYFCTTGAGGATNEEKKKNSKDATDKCNAGQNSEVVYVNTGNNKPAIMRYIQYAGVPVYQVMSTESR